MKYIIEYAAQDDIRRFIQEWGIPCIDITEFLDARVERFEFDLEPTIHLPYERIWLETTTYDTAFLVHVLTDKDTLFHKFCKEGNFKNAHHLILMDVCVRNYPHIAIQVVEVHEDNTLGGVFFNVDPQAIEGLGVKVFQEGMVETFSMLIEFLTLLQCRNVRLVDEKYDHKHFERLKRQKRPFVQFKILEIQPTKAPKSEKSHSATPWTPFLPLHMVRGHIKDYSEGAGLFGKYHGKYYWTPNLRGNIENGLNISDYKWKTP